MSWAVSALGALIVALVLRDIFHTLWHPQGFGSLAHVLFAGIWRAAHLGSGKPRGTLTGPLGMLVTVLVWTLLLVAGWALVYLPHMPDGFHFGSPLRPDAASDLVASIYLALVAVTTLGLGDIVPAETALRLAVPVQALIGFVLLTAGISWVLQIYPALAHRRSLAKHLTNLGRGGMVDVVREGSPSVLPVLDAVATRLSEIAIDLKQYRESYYFRDPESTQSLAAAMPVALELCEAAQAAPTTEVQRAGRVLQLAVDGLAESLEPLLPSGGTTDEVMAAFAEDHGHPVEGHGPAA